MNPIPICKFESLEDRRLFAANPIGINYNDEAMSGDHMAYALAEARKLGVGALRIWLGVKNYDDRPNAWDSDPKASAIGLDNQLLRGGYASSMYRAFVLKHLGFKVVLSVVPDAAAPFTSAAAVTAFFTHLMNSPQVPGGTELLKDVVDQWEIGNEPDLPSYWSDSAQGVTTGLRSYVDKLLLPAAAALHSGPTSIWEKVISGGVSNKPDDMNTILTYLKDKGQLGAIDYAGFHPYATFDPDVSGSNVMATNILLAKQYADAAGKPMIATEWNVRGYGTDGTKDAKWARAIDLNYRNYILPYFDSSYYFAEVNNWAYRGGTVTARPAGVLKHSTNLAVTPSSEPDLIGDYTATPLVEAEPFFSTLMTWQYGTVSGKVTSAATTQAMPGARVFIDVNSSGAYELGEPTALSAANGNYSITYSTRDVTPGNYAVMATTLNSGLGTVSQAIAANSVAITTNVNLVIPLVYVSGSHSDPRAATGSISGVIYHDFSADGVLQDLDRMGGSQLLYIDLNDNSVFDEGEPNAATSTDAGGFKITFDPSAIDGLPHAVRVALGDGWSQTQTPIVTLSLTDQFVGTTVGLLPPFAAPARVKGSINGVVWTDTNADGILNNSETVLAGRVIYIDANNNSLRDAGEYAVLSNSSGVYRFRSMAAGTYVVRIESSGSEQITKAPGGFYTIDLATDQRLQAQNFGIAGTQPGSINGLIFGDANNNGIYDSGDSLGPNRVAFIDTNRNLAIDAGEKQVTSGSDGKFTFTNLTPGTYYVTRVFPSGYKMSNNALGYLTITVASGQAVTGANIGSVQISSGTKPPSPTTATGSISGYLWSDTNANGVQDISESRIAARVVYIDANGNNKLDAIELQVTTDTNGNYTFNNLVAGTYRITRVLPSGYKIVTPKAGYQSVTLASTQIAAAINLGSKAV